MQMTLVSDVARGAAMDTLQTDGTGKKPPAGTATTSAENDPSRIATPASQATSAPSTAPSPPSTRRYEQPRRVRQLTAQILSLATDVINGDVQGEALDRARLFSSLTRTAAQLIATEVSRARFRQEEPDLTIEDPQAEVADQGRTMV